MKKLLVSHFLNKPRLLFITVKGTDKWQKIGKINDLIRRVSDDYFIVRESNKTTDGYHFHAIVSQRKDIKPNWYRKGIHINVKTIGDQKKSSPVIPESEEHLYYQKYGTLDVLDNDDKLIADHMNRVRHQARAKHFRTVKLTHLERVVDYVLKDWSTGHTVYLDYILKSPRGGDREAVLNRLTEAVVKEPLAIEPPLAGGV